MYYHNLFKIMQFYRKKEMEWAKHATAQQSKNTDWKQSNKMARLKDPNLEFVFCLSFGLIPVSLPATS